MMLFMSAETAKQLPTNSGHETFISMSNLMEEHQRGIRRDSECEGKAGSSVGLWRGSGQEGVGGVQTPHWPPAATPNADECSEGNMNTHTQFCIESSFWKACQMNCFANPLSHTHKHIEMVWLHHYAPA